MAKLSGALFQRSLVGSVGGPTRYHGVMRRNDGDSPGALVARGYDRIATRFGEWSAGVRVDERERYTRLVTELNPAGARLLDLGCGAGAPTTKRLAEHFVVTGVDISPAQVAMARQNAPKATIVQADLLELTWPDASFAVVTAFYSITHLPRDRHAEVFAKIWRWLTPGGMFVAALGANDHPDAVDADWLGAPMFFSHFDAATNQRLLVAAGFTLEHAAVETAVEDGRPTPFLWVVARRPSQVDAAAGQTVTIR